ncbi:FAD-dependent oxidoreductase [Agrilactobacillus yilanensis]|uniref:L-aspartate oxidase n=1 Tax=Agrilactobacillus yilanensis TaxID=2485997 RepID=A0ABW4J4L8_9LACO|nr:FAD-dependent oxidoreductase [Agrilactobacillus yilanensis]
MKKVIIIGAGLAGCYLAMLLQKNCQVTLVTKGARQDSNSMLAQGGIAAALDPGDSPAAHEQDTLKAGQYHNQALAVEQLVHVGPELVQQLIAMGMNFDRKPTGDLDFGLEGAHSHHRILHANGDQTGAALTTFVQRQLAYVTWLTNTAAIELYTNKGVCQGVLVRDIESGQQRILTADAIVLATGGLGNLYDFTTNNETITGDGLVLAARQKVALKDMAFVQFHPTVLALNNRCYGLITEAIRGSGAILVDEHQTPIMADTPQKDLAPRDVVARRLKLWQQNGHQLFLDITNVSDFTHRFAGVCANLDKHHVPFRKTHLIPIQPGAHFMMGGIQTDLSAQTSLSRLFAVGEVACNGVHGANRLASNSLLDCLVSAQKAAMAIMTLTNLPLANFKYSPTLFVTPKLPTLAVLQKKAWHYLGIERTRIELRTFLIWLKQYNFLQLQPSQLSQKELTIANLCYCAQLIAEAALAEPKSIGAHYLKEEITHESSHH